MTVSGTNGDIALKDLPATPSDSESNEAPYYDEDLSDTEDNAHTQLLVASAKQYPPRKTAHVSESPPPETSRLSKILFAVSLVILCAAIIILGRAAELTEKTVKKYCYKPGPKLPEYFDPTKTDFRGPTAIGRAPLLAAEDSALGRNGREGSLELDVYIEGSDGKAQNESIWKMMGHLTPWYMDER